MKKLGFESLWNYNVHKFRVFTIREQAKKVNKFVRLADWLGEGLQTLIRWFESNT